jgi:hypothetical protein
MVARVAKQSQERSRQMDIPIFLDPALLRAAQRIYRRYYGMQNKLDKRPCGVAINRETHRGQLIFRENPILLPGEVFISLKELETEI